MRPPPLRSAVLVKMDNKPFAAGAMRECFAMKKLSTFAAHRDWARADNMVAKSYIKPVNPQVRAGPAPRARSLG